MITQLAANCWVPSWDGDTRDDQSAFCGGHYAEPGKIPGFEGFTAARNAFFHKGCDGIVVFGLGGGYCTSCEDENVGDEEWEIREITPRQLPRGCWEVICDGPLCGYCLGDDDEAASHYAGRECAAERARENRWTVAENLTVCPSCNGEQEAAIRRAFGEAGP
jgi:hypothetical protein